MCIIQLLVARSLHERVVFLWCGAEKPFRAEPLNRGPCQRMGYKWLVVDLKAKRFKPLTNDLTTGL